ncbi:hypothetical protein J6590_067530 [Homalodisca vitripennis]|nr:hypothetical protein J6590_067530 [Homalodisca vitripennis]
MCPINSVIMSLEDVWSLLSRHEHIDSHMRDLLECVPQEFDPEYLVNSHKALPHSILVYLAQYLVKSYKGVIPYHLTVYCHAVCKVPQGYRPIAPRCIVASIF